MPALSNSALRRFPPAKAIALLLASLALCGCQQPQPPGRATSSDRPSQNTDRERADRQEHRTERREQRADRREVNPDRQEQDPDQREDAQQSPYQQERRGGRHGQNARSSSDQDPHFDYYLLNLSWSPEFCFRRPDAAECAEHRAFTLHGLWPQRLDGSYPEHCTDAPAPQDTSRFQDLYPDSGLLRHEWQTHGTCSGLDANTFFESARAAVARLRIPDQLTHLDHQVALPPDQILTLFIQNNPDLPRGSLALSCGNNFLTAVELCLDKQLHPMACGPIRSCRANSVRIPPVTR